MRASRARAIGAAPADACPRSVRRVALGCIPVHGLGTVAYRKVTLQDPVDSRHRDTLPTGFT